VSTAQLFVPLHLNATARAALLFRLTGRGSTISITVTGEIDLSTAHLLTELVEQVVADRPTRVVLDMAEVSFFCADGLRALLHARDTVAAAGGQLVLRNPSGRVWRVLTITHTDHVFPLDTDVATAAR
jgi:anti-anti-sigma factor